MWGINEYNKCWIRTIFKYYDSNGWKYEPCLRGIDRPDPNSLFFSFSSFFDEGMKRLERRRDFRVVVGVLIGVWCWSFWLGEPSWRFSRACESCWLELTHAARSCWLIFGELLLSIIDEMKLPPFAIKDLVEELCAIWKPSKYDKSVEFSLFVWWLDDNELVCLSRTTIGRS